MSCLDPPTVDGANVVTGGPYINASTAVYSCTSGYVMVGEPFITCDNGTWQGLGPTCYITDSNNIWVSNYQDSELPTWLLWLIGGTFGLLAALLLTCVLVWCCQLCGCFGAGGMFGEQKFGGCLFCRRQNDLEDPSRSCRTLPRRYDYDETGRRFHLDDYGRRCYYLHKNKHTNRVTHNGPPSYMADNSEPCEDRRNSSYLTTVTEVAAEKRQAPAKEVQDWMPHAKPIRKINTSTK